MFISKIDMASPSDIFFFVFFFSFNRFFFFFFCLNV